MDHQQNPSINLDETFSEDTLDAFQAAELRELMFEEIILNQHHKLFDIIEELDDMEWSNYTYGDGFKMLSSIVEQLNEIRANSLDLPEFIEKARAPPTGRYNVDYAYIHKILRDWRIAKELIDVAKTNVYNLPVFPRKNNPRRNFSRNRNQRPQNSVQSQQPLQMSQSVSNHSNDWICIKTDHHPEELKPKHYGKIMKFSDLFTKSFQHHQVYNPLSKKTNNSRKAIEIIPFDGENIEFYREFEQGVLIKIINDETMDWTSKFFLLLKSTSGMALSTLQIYTDDLDMTGFVQAIEDLYYTYGRPENFKEALIHQLKHQEPINLKNPETFQNTNALIRRILKTFSANETDVLSMSFIIESVKMTPEVLQDYKTWLIATNKKKDIPSFTEWLSISYAHAMDPMLKARHTEASRSSKPPVLMGSWRETVDDSDSSENE